MTKEIRNRKVKAVTIASVLLAGLFAVSAAISAPASARGDENKLIAVLKSSASLKEKDAACASLKRIGTAASIPALAALLTNKDLSHSARYALEPMSSPEAGKALVDALSKTTGGTRIGIIDSVAMRADNSAIPELSRLLNDPDAATACASASALGEMNDGAATSALQKALTSSAEPLRRTIVDSLLRSANRMHVSGKEREALNIYTHIFKTEKAEQSREAAFTGMIRASGKHGLTLATEAIQGKNDISKIAALRLLTELNQPGVNKAVAALLSKVDPATQIALLQALSFREAIDAATEIVKLLHSPDSSVRVAAASALGNAGTAKQAEALAEFAAGTQGEEQTAAREALQNLRHGPVADELMIHLQQAKPEVQMELARALGARRDRAAVPKLLQLADQGSDSAKKGALLALPYLIAVKDLPALVHLVVSAASPDLRAAATESLNASCQRLKARDGGVDASPIVDVLNNAPTDAKVSLLSICGGLNDEAARNGIRKFINNPDPQIHHAAIGALCDSADAELLPDAVKLACTEKDESLRIRATQACVRLTTQDETVKMSTAQKIQVYKTIFESNPSDPQKKMLLAGIGEIPSTQAFTLVEPLIKQTEVRTEAQLAAVKIGSGLAGPETEKVLPTIKEIAASAASDSIRQQAEAVLSQFASAAEFITTWQVAGPFKRKGSDFSAVFDIPFAPENFKSPNIKWQALPVSTLPENPRVINLLKALGGGEQCAAYARTAIWSPEDQPARLEMGSDDGLKVWLNGLVIHAQNVARPLQFGSDKADVHLKKGWNTLMLKVTQNNQGWEFCVRIIKPDGGHLEGLKVEARLDPKEAEPSGADQ